MAAADIDVGFVAASYALPEKSIQSLITAPTTELVQSLLRQIAFKAHEFDDLKSEKLRSEVELEAAVHNADTRARASKATTDSAVNEIEALRRKLSESDLSRQDIENQLQTHLANASSSSSQIQTLESRIGALEAQNRDTFALLEAKSTAYDRLAEDLSAQHQKYVAVRKQFAELEEKNQALDTAATGIKFREMNFQQEIELLRKNNDWLEAELKTRGAENSKTRKEKNVQIAELQRANADANQTIDTLRNMEISQTKRISDLEQRVEQSLHRIEQLQEDAARHQESFRIELDNTKRLAALHQESANTVKNRLIEVQDQLTAIGDQAAEEVGRLQAELESERSRAAEYENRIAEVETLLESQENQMSQLRSSAHITATPRAEASGPFSPMRAGSPMLFSPGGSRLKGGLSTTQLYAENSKLRADVRILQEREEKRSATMNEMLEELENRQPEIEELRQENERLTSETGEISVLLEEAIKEKENSGREMRKLQGEVQGLTRQRELDRQLIRDATFQSKLLLYHRKQEEDGLPALSQEEADFLRETVNDEVPERLLDDDDTATSRLLSKHLVLFRDVSSLIQKNQQLLRTIREVAEQYEGSEAQAKAAEQEQDRAELSRLRDRLAQYEDEINSSKLRSQSFMKERDMYRRIATSKGRMSEAPTATPPPGDNTINDLPDHSKDTELIKQLQSRLDIVNAEIGADRSTFKTQIDDLAKENRQLQTENVRMNTKHELTQQRFELQQQRIDDLETQNTVLKKRCADLQDDAARLDLQKQQDSENLYETRSQLESLIRENTNLKASQSLFQEVEARLKEDKKMLIEDKARLNSIITDIQTLHNQHDLSESFNRHNLQIKSESLESELQNVKRKLEDEQDAQKRTSARHELDQAEKQKKIDDLLQAANEARSELASTKSARDHLQTQITALQSELQNVEARSHNAVHLNGSAAENEHGESSLNRLTVLQTSLRRAEEQLNEANAQIEAYKSIAQDAEDKLQSNFNTQEELEAELARLDQEKDARIKELEQRTQEISTELATTNSELSELRGDQQQEHLKFVKEKDLLESEIIRFKEEVNDYKSGMESERQHVVLQADIATKARQDYENEFTKHGETMNALRVLRGDFDNLKKDVTQFRARAEATAASLAQREEQLASVKDDQERALEDANARYNTLNESHKTLYAQYDSLNTQLANLRNNRLSLGVEHTDAVSSDAGVNGLQILNKTLREDKDILQLQLSTKELELQRANQDLAYKQDQLDQANEKLISRHSQAQSRDTNVHLQAYQESIEQLNLYRESTTTLRNDNRRLEAEVDKRQQEITILRNEAEPLQTRVLELEGELEVSNGHLKALEEDRDRWQKRHQDVLQRYDRIDPQELEDLKKKIEGLQTQRDEALEKLADVESRIEAVRQEEKAKWDERRENFVRQAKERARTDTLAKKDMTAERDQARSELQEVQTRLEAMQDELLSTQRARDDAVAQLSTQVDAGVDEGQINESNDTLSAEERNALEARVASAENNERSASNQAVHLGIQLEAMKEKERTLENQVGELHERIRVLNVERSEAENYRQQLQAQAQIVRSQETKAAEPTGAPESEEAAQLREELTVARKEVNDLRKRLEEPDSLADVATNGDTVFALNEARAEIILLQNTLAQHEASMNEVETKLHELQAEAARSKDESSHDIPEAVKQKMEKLKQKSNERIAQKTAEIESIKLELAEKIQEISDLRLELQEAASTNVNATTKLESLPGPEATERETQDWLHHNPIALAIMKRNLAKQVQAIKAEQVKTQEQNHEPSSAMSDQEQLIAQKVEEANASAKSLHDKQITQKVEETRLSVTNTMEKRFAAKESLAKNRFNKLKAQWDVVEQAANETPEKAVKEVFEMAKVAKAVPAPPVNIPVSNQPASAPAPSTTSSGQIPPSLHAGQGQLASGNAGSTLSLPNGSLPNSLSQPNPGYNPFAQPQSAGQALSNPVQNQNQSHLVEVGFGQRTQPSSNPSQPTGFGRGDVGTGSVALRNTGNAQAGPSGIPRGGASGIPVPGGRGRGPQSGQPAQVPGNSQASRGGNRGGGRGRGGQAPGSPMNPTALDFQPGIAGRGQKRGPDDETAGSQRGGKRARGGRGGGGGAATGGE